MFNSSIDPLIEIGGYFGLDLPYYGDPFPNALKFQSGRAALRTILDFTGVQRVFLPLYICDSVIQAILESGAVTEPYDLNESLYPKNIPNPLPDKSVVLYVNYFGLCDANIKQLLQEVPNKQLIIDNTQSLFSLSEDALANVYSIRKFLGVPDGGLLVVSANLDIRMPENEDTDSLKRMEALLLRMAYTARNGYSSFIESEKTLCNTEPLKMSRLTSRIMASIDMGTVKRKRRNNFFTLAIQLDRFNERKWLIGENTAPLCYPLLLNRNVEPLRQTLINKGIYIPTYWPEVKAKIKPSSLEYRFSNCCLFLPCDQRYSTHQMDYIVREVISGLENEIMATKS